VRDRGSGGFEIDTHATAQRRRDVDQGVERKARNPAADQIADPWLRYAATVRGFGPAFRDGTKNAG